MKKKYLYLKKGILLVLSASTIAASMPYSVYADCDASAQNSVDMVTTSSSDSGNQEAGSTGDEMSLASEELLQENVVGDEQDNESKTESENEVESEPQSEPQNKTAGESESAVNSQTGGVTVAIVEPSTQSEAGAESTEDPGNQETESADGQIQSQSEDNTTKQSSQSENNIYTISDVKIVKVEEQSSLVNGAQNGYKFTFNKIEDATKIYSAHVYGNGVDEDVLKELAAAYFNGLNGIDSSVENDEFTDAEKHSENHNYSDYDSDLCWVYAASDAAWQTGWTRLFDAGIFNVGDNASAYFKSEDDLTDYAAYCMNNYAGYESDFWEWLFTGEFKDSDTIMKYGTDVDDQLLYAYYSEDLFKRIFISDTEESFNYVEKSFNSSYLDDVAAKKAAATLGIYYVYKEPLEAAGGHALSLTGYISDSEGNPVAVILADPDDSVKSQDEPDDPRLKKNKYEVDPIILEEIKGKNYYSITPNNYYYTLLSDMFVLANSDNKTKVNASRIPLEQRGISASFNNSGEYSFDSDYSFSIPVSPSFLSYYDINSIKYKLYDEAGNLVTDALFSSSKSNWKQMIQDQKSEISLYFEDALRNLSDGKYRLEAFIDQECFYGNYGWFASKANDGAGYFDKLVDTWITLFRYIPESRKDDESDTGKSNDTSSNGIASEEVKAYQEEVLQAIVREITTDLSNENVKDTVKEVLTDLMKALAKDEAAIAKISVIGIDLSKVDIKDLKVVAFASINAPKAGKMVLSGKSLAKLNKDKAFAMIKLADGTTCYVKINVKADGSIEMDVPQNAKELTLLSL